MKISELKKDAIAKLSGKWGKAVGIYLIFALLSFGLSFVPSFAAEDSILAFVLNVLMSLLMSAFSYGVLASMIKLSRTENVDLMDFVTVGLKNIVKVIKISLLTFLRLWLPILLYVISIGTLGYTIYAMSANTISTTTILGLLIGSIILTLVSFIMYYVQSLLYALSYYLLFDNPNAKTKELLNKSKELMSGKRPKYFLVGLSFFGWMLLMFAVTVLLAFVFPLACPLVVLISFLILMPYIDFSYINFYEDVAGISDVKP